MMLAFIVIICSFYCIDSTSYYFSSTLGNDNNSGTSSSSPWKSLSKAADLKLQPGDSILLRANNTFTGEQLVINNAHGTSTNPITVSSYELNTLYNRAKITLKNNSNSNTNSSILCINCEGITFSDLELCNTKTYGISLMYTPSSKTLFDYILIENNYFHNIHANGPNNTDTWWGSAINIESQDPIHITVTNYIIRHNLANETDTFNRQYNVGIISGRMNGNLLTHNYYNIVSISSFKNFIVDRNVFLNNTPITNFIYGTTDLIIGNLQDNSTSFVNNEFGNRGEYPTAPDGCSIDFETGAYGTIVRNNYIYNSYGGGIMVYGHPPLYLSNALNIDNNIFIQDGCYQTHGDHGAIAITKSNTSGIIQNNYFVRCENISVPIINDNGQNQNLNNWTFVNNTIVNTTKQIVDKPKLYFDQQIVYNNIMGQQKVVLVSAKCGDNVANDCDIRYTIDGSKPIINSTKYAIGEQIMIVRTSGILFKSFAEGMIESQATGCILNPEKKGKAGCDVI